MRVVIVNKSDTTGGAAVVSFRLMEALRSAGVDARMLVAEKLSDSQYVAPAAGRLRLKASFIADRLRIAMANGFDRRTLFKLDAAAYGMDIINHPWVKSADAILINWINQGLLSLADIRRLGQSGKRIVWTMHDMWNLTGLCHHAGSCRRYTTPGLCGHCPLLGSHAGQHDFSEVVARRKERLYDEVPIDFVAVSSWLRRKSEKSTLLHGRSVTVIPNAFRLPPRESLQRIPSEGAVRLIFGAARLDDTVKGFTILIEAMKSLKSDYPELASRTRLLLYGAIRDASLIERIPIEVEYVGVQHGMDNISRLYLRSDIVLSTSHFETLPGTLVEGQAYGCVPVSFARGGQPDIIDDRATGYLAAWSDDESQAGANIAASVAQAVSRIELEGEAMRERMYESVSRKFSAAAVARAYIALLQRPR